MNSILKKLLFWSVLVLIGVVIWKLSTPFGPPENTIMFSEFMNWVDTGQVAKVTINGDEIRGTTRANAGRDTFRTHTPNYASLVPRLLEKGVQVDVKPASSGVPPVVYSLVWLLVLVAFPVAVLVLGVAMLRRMRSIDDKLDRLTSAGGAKP